MYRRFYKREQKEIERRRQAIRLRFAHRKQSTSMKTNEGEGPISLAGTTEGAAGVNPQLGIIHESSVSEEKGFKSLIVSSPDPDFNYASKELADEVINIAQVFLGFSCLFELVICTSTVFEHLFVNLSFRVGGLLYSLIFDCFTDQIAAFLSK